MRQMAFFRRFTSRINYFWTFLWRTSNLILRPIKPSSLKLKKAEIFMQEFRDKMMGHAFDVAVLKLKSNGKNRQKKSSFLDYFFYRSLKLVHLHIFLPDCSTVTKQDSRCRHTYVYNVHKVSLLSTTLQAVYSKDTSIEMRQRAFLGALPAGSTIWTFLWRTSNLILRPIKPSSLKLKKAEIFMKEFRDRMMGHAFRHCGFKIKVKLKGIGKKKRQFSGLLFF